MTDAITTPVEPHAEGTDPLMDMIRPAIREAIETAIEDELRRQLGAPRYARVVDRVGYRNGHRDRVLGTAAGAITVTVPRARVGDEEWRSAQLPRYHRRLRGVDQALLGIYLSGTNQRKVAAAVRPLLRGLGLSKSTISRLAMQLRSTRDAWEQRSLADERIAYLFLDGFVVPVRRDGRVVRHPVLVAVGVRETGDKVLLALRLAAGETTRSWRALLEQLIARGLAAPQLCIVDGSAGLRAALEHVWPGVAVQRCTAHKLQNVLAHAPDSAHADVRKDFHRIVYASTTAEGERQYHQFLRRWRMRCAAVARSLEEGGPELLTFLRYPSRQWKSLRSTNVIERIHGELRRRIKTQGAWADEEAIVTLLFGLFVAGLVRLRRIDGWQTIRSASQPTVAA
jgi:transposase-like protein